jgi:S1-C subfamily serine protease
MFQRIAKIFIVFIFGIAGGIFADQILWPYFIERPLFYEYRLEQKPIEVIEEKNTIIQENEFLQQIVPEVEKSLVAIEIAGTLGRRLLGSGVVITADGLVVALAESVPSGSSLSFSVENEKPEYQILKKDLDKNLALIKLEKDNLIPVKFAGYDSLELGQRVFSLANIELDGGYERSVNEGIIKHYTQKIIQTSIQEEESVQGGPLFNIKGGLTGLLLSNKEGSLKAVSIKEIREFSGF